MYISYELYQVDRIRTTREQREEDIHAGELAADFARLWRSLAPRRTRRAAWVPQTAETRAARATSSAQSC